MSALPVSESEWIDISVPVYTGMPVWPGDEPMRREQMLFLEKGDACNLSRMTLSVHTGTHMDAPRHFVMDAPAMETLPLDAVLGPARVIEILDPVAIQPHELPEDLQAGERILFKTLNSAVAWQNAGFYENFVYISKEAAAVLAQRRVRTVGLDYLSVGGFFKDGAETHEALLGAGIWVIEGLDLSQVTPGRYELACLPLKLIGSDGAPARAALRPIR